MRPRVPLPRSFGPPTPAPGEYEARTLQYTCPLCASLECRPFAEVQGRRYLDCPNCRLVHMHAGDRLGREAERAVYALHQNDPGDPGYRRFLSRLAQPLLTRVRAGMQGLDYGSGPGPTLSVLLEERGLEMTIYDPFFAPDPRALSLRYDFVTCTETAEHFFAPGREFATLARLLRAGGLLAIMTEVLGDQRVFAEWAYARDPTHVCFYRRETLEWLGSFLRARLSRPHPNVAFFELGA